MFYLLGTLSEFEGDINKYVINEVNFALKRSMCNTSVSPIIYHCKKMNAKTKNSERMKDAGIKWRGLIQKANKSW
jgi:hypothetical protein